MEWFVYMALCADKSIYTGSTTDVKRRFEEHLSNNGAKYTRSHKIIKIIHTERFDTRGKALKREAEIKKLTKSKKLLLADEH